MNKKDRTMFDKFVDRGSDLLRSEHQTWGDSPVDAIRKRYRQMSARGQEDLLQTLMQLSKDDPTAGEAVAAIARDLCGKQGRAPRQLMTGLVQLLDSKGGRPTTRRRNQNGHVMRNRAFVIAILVLSRKGLKPTRNMTQGQTDVVACSFEGGSASDVVGLAAARVYAKELKNKPLAYKTIERIFFQRHSRGTSRKSLLSLLLTLLPSGQQSPRSTIAKCRAPKLNKKRR